MNQKERMLQGLPYLASDAQLVAEREACARKVHELNMLPPGERVFMTQGYDESVAVIQNVRHIDWPAIIAEDRSGGTLTLLEGGHDSHTQSLWIMNQPVPKA